jgi:5'-nucleotidase
MQPSPSRRRFARATALVAATTIGIVGAGALSASAAPGDVAIDVYTINDFHGHLEQNLGSGEAGAASIATAIDSFRLANPNTAFVSSGDNISGSPFISQALNDEPTIDVLNQMGLSVSAIGNHEFDKGRADLDGRVSDRSTFDYISANLYEKGTTQRAYAPYDVQTIGGIRVGFVSAVTEDLPTLVSPDGIATLDVRSIVDGVNSAATELRDGVDDGVNLEADVVVLLVHEGAASAGDSLTDINTVFGRIVTGTGPNVDAIASAHTHNLYAQTVTVGAKTIPVLQTGSFGTHLGHLNFLVNPVTKQITASSASNIRLVTPAVVGGAAAAAVYPQDPEIAAIVADAKQRSSIIGRVSIGSITDSFTRALQSDGTTENRGGESDLGNEVADGQLWATQDLGTQIAFMNPGGLRTNIAFAANTANPQDSNGNVTYEEAATVQPFANTLITQTVTGAQVKTVLEQQWQTGQSRPFLKLGISADLTYTYDPAAADGSHVTQIFYKGAPIAAEDTFKIVTNSFLAAGGDGFLELAKGQGKTDTGRVDLDAFVNYIGANSPLAPDYTTRSVGIANLADPAGTPVDFGTTEPGTSYEFALSSLLLGGVPPSDAELQVFFDDEQIATAEIDPTVVDKFDEQGRATVAFTLPETLRNGDHTVSFQIGDAGLRLTFPLVITGGIPDPVVDPTTPSVGAGTPGTVAPGSAAPAGQAALAATGVDATLPLVGSGLLLALGALLVVRRRRGALTR